MAEVLTVSDKDLTYDCHERAYYAGQLFTGTACLYHANGQVWQAQEYLQGQKHGWERQWDAAGTLGREAHYWYGVDHGLERSWHDLQQLAEEIWWERGIVVRHRRWREDGILLTDEGLNPMNAEILRQYRQVQPQRWPVPWADESDPHIT